MSLSIHWTVHLAKLVGLIVLLPLVVTYEHLEHMLLRRTGTCLVGPASASLSSSSLSDPSDPFGMYRPVSGGVYALVHRPFFSSDSVLGGSWRRLFPSFSRYGWPSAASVSIELSTPSSTLLRKRRRQVRRNEGDKGSEYVIVREMVTFGGDKGGGGGEEEDGGGGARIVEGVRWCLRRRRRPDSRSPPIVGAGGFCSETTTNGGGGDEEGSGMGMGGRHATSDRSIPPSGTWFALASRPIPAEEDEEEAALRSGKRDDASPLASKASESMEGAVRVHCPGPSSLTGFGGGGGGLGSFFFGSNTLAGGVRRNPNKWQEGEGKANKNVEQIVRRPATTLLLTLNVLLAFAYWSRHVNPSSVAKIYSKVVFEGEIWRSFTGATAHFEPLHIGFNMMSLYSLGTELEEGYGSIPFFYYNVALVVLTTAAMMAITYVRIKRTGNDRLAETSTVGYSGVLFAWMVVASLERPRTCPLPFAPDVCFDTRSYFGGLIEFNASPILQLFVAQFIMPRVSFVGHLAGILCGFALHWGAIPSELASPCVLLPAALLAHMHLARKILPLGTTAAVHEEEVEMHGLQPSSSSSSSSSLDGENGDAGPGFGSDRRNRRNERGLRFPALLERTKIAMTFSALASPLFLHPVGSMVLSQLLCLAFFTCGVRAHSAVQNVRAVRRGSYVSERDLNREKARGGAIWKGAILSLTLTVVADSMAMASWMSASLAVSAGRRSLVGLGLALAWTAFRIALDLVALVLSAGALYDLGEVGGGIFIYVFGFVVRWSKAVMDGALSAIGPKPLYVPFEGRGVALGGGSLLNSMSDPGREDGGGHIL